MELIGGGKKLFGTKCFVDGARVNEPSREHSSSEEEALSSCNTGIHNKAKKSPFLPEDLLEDRGRQTLESD